MLEIKNLSLMFADRVLFENANFALYAGQRYGLIGPNGAGKSSLFNIILGRLAPDSGEVIYPKDLQVSYCEQECAHLNFRAIDYVICGYPSLGPLWIDLQAAQKDQNFEKIATITTKIDQLGAYDIEARAAIILRGLGFSHEELTDDVGSFSGGWRMRLNLARALLAPSELLILDEPTNHLDLEAIVWLEKWIKEYPGTLFLVSHDKAFLDALVTHIVSVEQKTFKLYKGNYSQYNAARLLQEQALISAQKKAQAQREHLESFINRFKAKASKASQAQSRIKALEKLPDIKLLSSSRGYDFNFEITQHPSYPALQIKQADLGYSQESILLHQINFSLAPGEKIGILGPNGAGKSTFLKACQGQLVTAQCFVDKKSKIGYFAQHQVEALDLNLTALELFEQIAPSLSVLERRKYLGRYGFCEQKAHDQIKLFSGGERSRLTLAFLMWQKPNVLLLDEPTNHLDIEVREALCSALQLYEGALMIISHDKALLESCVDTYYLVESGQVKIFEGSLKDYQSYVQKKSQQSKRQQSADKALKAKTALQSKEQASVDQREKDEKSEKKLSYELRKHLDKLERKMQKIENQCQALDERMAQCSEFGDLSQLMELSEQKSKLIEQLRDLEEQWLFDQE